MWNVGFCKGLFTENIDATVKWVDGNQKENYLLWPLAVCSWTVAV